MRRKRLEQLAESDRAAGRKSLLPTLYAMLDLYRAWHEQSPEHSIAKAEPIAAGEDYTAAQSQKAAMAKAKVSLRAAVGKAVRDNAGYRAVSITPSLKDGRPVADVTLAKGDELKTVSVPL